LFASIPPYLDIAIVFYTFVWAGMVWNPRVQSGDQLVERRTSRNPAGRRNDSESLDTTNSNAMRVSDFGWSFGSNN